MAKKIEKKFCTAPYICGIWKTEKWKKERDGDGKLIVAKIDVNERLKFGARHRAVGKWHHQTTNFCTNLVM